MALLQIYLYLTNLTLGVKKVQGFEEPVAYDSYDLVKQDLREYVTKFDMENTRDYYVVNGNNPDLPRERVSREQFIEYYELLVSGPEHEWFIDCYNFLFDGLSCEAVWDHPNFPKVSIFKYHKGVTTAEIEDLCAKAKEKWPRFWFEVRVCHINNNSLIYLQRQ